MDLTPGENSVGVCCPYLLQYFGFFLACWCEMKKKILFETEHKLNVGQQTLSRRRNQ